jgi:hypothetical protein
MKNIEMLKNGLKVALAISAFFSAVPTADASEVIPGGQWGVNYDDFYENVTADIYNLSGVAYNPDDFFYFVNASDSSITAFASTSWCKIDPDPFCVLSSLLNVANLPAGAYSVSLIDGDSFTTISTSPTPVVIDRSPRVAPTYGTRGDVPYVVTHATPPPGGTVSIDLWERKPTGWGGDTFLASSFPTLSSYGAAFDDVTFSYDNSGTAEYLQVFTCTADWQCSVVAQSADFAPTQ